MWRTAGAEIGMDNWDKAEMMMMILKQTISLLIRSEAHYSESNSGKYHAATNIQWPSRRAASCMDGVLMCMANLDLAITMRDVSLHLS